VSWWRGEHDAEIRELAEAIAATARRTLGEPAAAAGG